MPDARAALAFSRADAAFSVALRACIARARLRGVIDPGMGPVIFTLEERDVLSMSSLAESVLVTRSTMTGIVRRMEKRGLVRTAPNPHDGRSILVGLTPKGRSVVPRLRGIEAELDGCIRERLTNSEIAILSELLTRLASAFSTTSY